MLLPTLLRQLAAAAPASRTERGSTPATIRAAPTYRPSRAIRPPQIDGRDDDSIWATAAVITDFRQWEPTEDGEPSVRTEARVAYDSRNLYVVVRCFDPRPDSLLAVLQRRDGFALSDDVILGVDSCHDGRTGYLFRLTAGGTMADG